MEIEINKEMDIIREGEKDQCVKDEYGERVRELELKKLYSEKQQENGNQIEIKITNKERDKERN